MPETDTGAATILVDEFDAGRFEGALNCIQGRKTRNVGAAVSK